MTLYSWWTITYDKLLMAPRAISKQKWSHKRQFPITSQDIIVSCLQLRHRWRWFSKILHKYHQLISGLRLSMESNSIKRSIYLSTINIGWQDTQGQIISDNGITVISLNRPSEIDHSTCTIAVSSECSSTQPVLLRVLVHVITWPRLWNTVSGYLSNSESCSSYVCWCYQVHTGRTPSYLHNCVTASADITSRPRLRSMHQQSTLRTAAHARAGSVSVFSSVFQKSVSVSVFQNIAISVSVFGFSARTYHCLSNNTITDTLRPPLSPEWGYGPSNLHYKLRP